jgi:hypothetical protein
MNSPLSRRLEAAVLALAGDGTLKDRLYAAFSDHLEDIDERELPEEIQSAFGDMTKTMHRARALPGDSVVRASVRKLSSEDAQRYSALVVRAYGLQIESLATEAGRIPGRMAALTRQQTPLAALLALEGGSGGARGVQDSPPFVALRR